jgi:hypothetical protein
VLSPAAQVAAHRAAPRAAGSAPAHHLAAVADELEAGAVIVFEPQRIRIREW